MSQESIEMGRLPDRQVFLTLQGVPGVQASPKKYQPNFSKRTGLFFESKIKN